MENSKNKLLQNVEDEILQEINGGSWLDGLRDVWETTMGGGSALGYMGWGNEGSKFTNHVGCTWH